MGYFFCPKCNDNRWIEEGLDPRKDHCWECGTIVPMSEEEIKRWNTEWITDSSLNDTMKYVCWDFGEVETPDGPVCFKFYRAEGTIKCDVCGKEYRDHPFFEHVDWLRKICKGDLVKL